MSVNQPKLTPASVFMNGLITENPTLRMLLGMCPTLAVSTSCINAIGMGLAATAVLTLSNIVISLIRNFIPAKLRIPGFIVVIATFVTMTDLFLHAYFPTIHKALGIFIPLIVVNCIILGRAEAFASKNNVVLSAIDGIGMGIGFTLALLVLAAFREFFGAGSLFDFKILPENFPAVIVMILAPGAFITLGIMIGIANWLQQQQRRDG